MNRAIDLKITISCSLATLLLSGCLGGGGGGGPTPTAPSNTGSDNNTTSTLVPGVDYTDPSQFMQTTNGHITSQLSQVNAQVAHNNGFTGGNISTDVTYTQVASDTSNRNLQTVVAVLDSGINSAHEDLNSSGKIEGWKDFSSTNSLTPYDSDGHGTFVSHIIAGDRQDVNDTYYGIAYGSNLLIGQVIEGGSSTNVMLQNAIDWVVTQKAAIDTPNVKQLVALNLSLGTNNSAFVNASFKTSLLNALSAGITIVSAAGNEGLSCLSSGGSINGQCSFPAAAPWIDSADTSSYLNNTGGWIVVGSVDSNNIISSFSNKAGVTKSNYLVAPGESVISASNTVNTGYSVGSGTSFSTPIVAGAMALMTQKWPHLNGRQHAQILFDTATDLGAPGIDNVYGNGLLNLTDAFNPVGSVAIPTGMSNVFTQGSAQTQNNTKLTTSSTILSLKSLMALNNTIGVDYYNRDFTVNLTDSIGTTGTSPIDFDNFLSFNYKNMIFGVDQLHNMIMLGFKLSKDSSIKLSYDDSFLGTQSQGALNLGRGSSYYLGYDKELRLNDDVKINLSSTYAFATSDTAANSLIQNVSDVHAISGEINAMYKNFGFGYEIPLRAIKGEMTFNTPTALDNQGNVIYSKLNADLKPDTFQQTYSIFFEKRLSDLYFLTKISQTKDAFGVSNLINNEAKVSLNYWY